MKSFSISTGLQKKLGSWKNLESKKLKKKHGKPWIFEQKSLKSFEKTGIFDNFNCRVVKF